MSTDLSPRLAAVVDALPLQPHTRVLEIGCGPGAAARAVAARLVTGHILAIDRSARAIAQAQANAAQEICSGRMSVRHVAVEPFDLAFAVRGRCPGRSPPGGGKQALEHIAAALKPGGRLLIDGGEPLREVPTTR